MTDQNKPILQSTITTKDGTQIYYKDWGSGQPVVFSHGWPLSADAWEDQMVFLSAHGYRCIAHDRLGSTPICSHSSTSKTSIEKNPESRSAAGPSNGSSLFHRR